MYTYVGWKVYARGKREKLRDEIEGRDVEVAN